MGATSAATQERHASAGPLTAPAPRGSGFVLKTGIPDHEPGTFTHGGRGFVHTLARGSSPEVHNPFLPSSRPSRRRRPSPCSHSRCVCPTRCKAHWGRWRWRSPLTHSSSRSAPSPVRQALSPRLVLERSSFADSPQSVCHPALPGCVERCHACQPCRLRELK